MIRYTWTHSEVTYLHPVVRVHLKGRDCSCVAYIDNDHKSLVLTSSWGSFGYRWDGNNGEMAKWLSEIMNTEYIADKLFHGRDDGYCLDEKKTQRRMRRELAEQYRSGSSDISPSDYREILDAISYISTLQDFQDFRVSDYYYGRGSISLGSWVPPICRSGKFEQMAKFVIPGIQKALQEFVAATTTSATV